MFSALSLLVLCFLFFFEALVLVTTFSLLKISFSSSVSHELHFKKNLS